MRRMQPTHAAHRDGWLALASVPIVRPIAGKPRGVAAGAGSGPNRIHGARKAPMLSDDGAPAPRHFVVITIAPGIFAAIG